MGMAASQARYLSLAARKTNTEYEGQQLNQQRLNLANQTADLFNQMLTMSVPTCPDSNDFTKIQYSYSDGINTFAIDDFYQISVPNEDYNYVVSSYHYEDVYTGKSYKMIDPQIQAYRTNNFSDYSEKFYQLIQQTYDKSTDTYILDLTRSGIDSTYQFRAANYSVDPDEVELLDYLYNRTEDVDPRLFSYDDSSDTYTFTPTSSAGFGLYSSLSQGRVTYSKVDMEDLEQKTNLLKSYGALYDSSKTYYVSDTGNSYFCKEDLDNIDIASGQKLKVRKKDIESYYTNGFYYVKNSDLDNIGVGDSLCLRSAVNYPMFSNYSAVGNCKLERVTTDEYNSNEDLRIELNRILDDVKIYNSTSSIRNRYTGGKSGSSESNTDPEPEPTPYIIPDIPDPDPTPTPTPTPTPDPDPTPTPDPDPTPTPAPDDEQSVVDRFSLSRGQNTTKTIKSDAASELTLRNPFDNKEYVYNVQVREGSGNQSVKFEFLSNGRLVITGNNLQITAADGQNDDIILKGSGNYLMTGDGDDIVRAGLVIDSGNTSYYNQYCNNNVIDTGSGNDHVAFTGKNNNINTGGGNDTVLAYNQSMITGSGNSISGAEISRSISNNDSRPSDVQDGWTNQLSSPDCRLYSLINSLVKNKNSGSLSQYVNIEQTSGGYTVTFPNYKGNTVDNVESYSNQDFYTTKSNDKSITITNSELAAYNGVHGDIDIVLLDLAMDKLVRKNQDVGKTSVGTAYYNTIANYIFGSDKVTLIDSTGNNNFANQLSTLWNLYQNNTISNLTVGIASGEDLKNGITTGHAYSIKDYTGDSITLVNPWNDADVLNLDSSKMNSLSMHAIVYGWTDDNNSYGLQAFNGKRAYIPNGGYISLLDSGLDLDNIEESQYIADIGAKSPISQASLNHGSGLESCFNEVGEYIEGSVYKFTMFGKTYYTTAADLDASLISALREDATASNGIDSQHNKLTYYSTIYQDTKVSESKRALVETDGRGRFSSIKFEDDSAVYALKVETITDDDAYRNAMNQYFYKQEQYDKAVADINTKTKVIQAEDRELMLRLEQLGTEQNALQTEMEACKKVISKNIEVSFKTFGG